MLPFGLSTPPFVFSKVVKALVNYWRAAGVCVLTFLDDGLAGGAVTYEVAVAHSVLVHESLDSSGMTLHPVNHRGTLPSPPWCSLVPAGFAYGVVGIELERVIKVVKALLSLSRSLTPLRRALSSLSGRLVSMAQVLGIVVRVMTRDLYAMLSDAILIGRIGVRRFRGLAVLGRRCCSGVPLRPVVASNVWFYSGWSLWLSTRFC